MLLPIKKEYLEHDNDSETILYTYENVSKKELQEEAEKLTFRPPYCGHAHDCCGCFHSQRAEVKSNNEIEVTQYYNY